MGGDASHVLVVEDDVDTSDMVQAILERDGHDVVAVHSGAEALAYLAHVPDRHLVLLDLGMSDMNGWEVLAELRAGERQHDVVIMTGSPDSAIPRGVHVLRKPFTAEQLREVVRARPPG